MLINSQNDILTHFQVYYNFYYKNNNKSIIMSQQVCTIIYPTIIRLWPDWLIKGISNIGTLYFYINDYLKLNLTPALQSLPRRGRRPDIWRGLLSMESSTNEKGSQCEPLISLYFDLSYLFNNPLHMAWTEMCIFFRNSSFRVT